MGNDRNRIAFRMRAETAQKIEQWQKASNCRSKNEFIEKAVNFYADYLALNSDNQCRLRSTSVRQVSAQYFLLRRYRERLVRSLLVPEQYDRLQDCLCLAPMV